MRVIIYSLLFILFTGNTFSQTGTCLNYFTSNQVYSIAEGKNCFWFANECKITRLDKISGALSYYIHQPQTKCFLYYNYNLLVDTADNLWLIGSDGLFKFDGNNWATVSTQNVGSKIWIDKNYNIWYCSDSLVKYDGNTFTKFYFPYSFTDIAFDSNNNLWISGYDGIMKFNGTIDTIFNKYNSSLPGDDLLSVAVDSSDNIWMSGNWMYDTINGFSKEFIAKYDGTNWIIHTDSTTGLPNIDDLHDIVIDQNQDVWCTGYNGVIKYNGSVWTIPFSSGTMGNMCKTVSLFIDSTGNKLLGTVGVGLLKFDGQNWNRIALGNSGLPGNGVMAIETDKHGVLWTGTEVGTINFYNDYGFARYDSSGWTNYSNSTSLIPNKADAMVNDHNGNLWVANSRFLHKYDGSSWQKIPVDLYGYNVSMAVDSSNHIWVASTYRDLREYTGSNFINYHSQDYGSAFNSYSKYVDVDKNDNVWIGTDLSVAKYDHINWTVLDCHDTTGNPCWGFIEALKCDTNNNVWICSDYYGLIKYDGQNYYKYLTQNNGTATEHLWSMAVDSLNNMYFGSYFDGLLKFDGTTWMRFNISNSDLMDNNINIINIAPNGIWLGTGAGMTKFDNCGGDTIFVTETQIILAASEIPVQHGFAKAYPSPFTNKIFVDYTFNKIVPIDLQIFNIQGESVKQIRYNPTSTHGRIEVSMDENLKQGLYLIKLKSNSEIFHLKVVK